MPPYEQKRNSRQILLKIVSSDEQKRNSPQILLKIVGKILFGIRMQEPVSG
jgi:hypothetical protein